MPEIGDCIGIGDSMEEAINACIEHIDSVKGFGVQVNKDALYKALSEVKKAEENNIIFSNKEIPSPKDFIE
jgi:hypothetical protein